MAGGSREEASQAGSLTSQDARVAACIAKLHRELLGGPYKEETDKQLTDSAADMTEAEDIFQFQRF